jgi:hypothetical protein
MSIMPGTAATIAQFADVASLRAYCGPVQLGRPSPGAEVISASLEMLIDCYREPCEADIFNRPAFHLLHRPRNPEGVYVQLRNYLTGKTVGVFHALATEKGAFASPGRGSYGGFEVIEDLPIDDLKLFISLVERVLKWLGGTRLDIVLPPLVYAPERVALAFNAMTMAGYLVSRQELNQSIEIHHRDFLTLGNYANRKRFNRAVREGVSARRLKREEFHAAYNVIVESRQKKNYAMSMSWPQIAEMVETFPDDIIVFGGFLHDAMIAAAICVRVNGEVLYVFSWGERSGFEGVSPVTVIAAALYRFARSADIRLLDLGTSSVHGEPNHGVFAFKKSLGAKPSIKMYFTKELE